MSPRAGEAAVSRLGNAALDHLRSLPERSLGPAARRLLGITEKPCPTCNGKGQVDG